MRFFNWGHAASEPQAPNHSKLRLLRRAVARYRPCDPPLPPLAPRTKCQHQHMPLMIKGISCLHNHPDEVVSFTRDMQHKTTTKITTASRINSAVRSCSMLKNLCFFTSPLQGRRQEGIWGYISLCNFCLYQFPEPKKRIQTSGELY
jgi:hypothetical protein